MKPLEWLLAIGCLLLVAPAHAMLTSQLNTPRSSAFCTGWASTKEACTEVTSIGEHGKISDRWGQITVSASAPELPSSTRTSKITIWAEASFTQIHVVAGFYKMTGLYNTIIPENSYGQLVTPTSAATLATFDLTINNSNRYQYCVLGKCTIPLTLTAAQAQAVSDWESSGHRTNGDGTLNWNVHPVEVDTVVNAWYEDSANVSKPHTSFHYVLNAPAVGGGCQIDPSSPPALPLIMIPFGVLAILAMRRRTVRLALLCSLCLFTSAAQASNIMAIGDADAATLQAAAANNTLGATIDAMLTQHAVTSGMTEGQTVMVGTPQAGGAA